MPRPEAHDAVAPHARGSTLSIKVVPRSARNTVDVQNDGQVRAHVTSPPVGGAANAMLVKLLSDVLGLPKSRISVLAGETGRQKRLLIEGIDPTDLVERLKRTND